MSLFQSNTMKQSKMAMDASAEVYSDQLSEHDKTNNYDLALNDYIQHKRETGSFSAEKKSRKSSFGGALNASRKQTITSNQFADPNQPIIYEKSIDATYLGSNVVFENSMTKDPKADVSAHFNNSNIYQSFDAGHAGSVVKLPRKESGVAIDEERLEYSVKKSFEGQIEDEDDKELLHSTEKVKQIMTQEYDSPEPLEQSPSAIMNTDSASGSKHTKSMSSLLKNLQTPRRIAGLDLDQNT